MNLFTDELTEAALSSQIFQSITIPSSEQLNLFLQMANQGDIRKILQQVSALETLDSEYSLFCQQVRIFADNLQVNQLQQFIRQYLE